MAVAMAGTVLLLGVAAIDLQALERGAILALVGGAALLGYGFANLGLPGALPVPLAEILLMPLVALAMARRSKPPASVAIPLGLWLALVAGRLLFDYPRWGVLAIRDSTTAIEALALLVGYGSALRDGAEKWRRRLSVLFALVFVYALAYPWRGVLGPLSPTVGLQRPERAPVLLAWHGRRVRDVTLPARS
jgi:hypothetical protein